MDERSDDKELYQPGASCSSGEGEKDIEPVNPPSTSGGAEWFAIEKDKEKQRPQCRQEKPSTDRSLEQELVTWESLVEFIVVGRWWLHPGDAFKDVVVVPKELECPRFDQDDAVPDKCSDEEPLDDASEPFDQCRGLLASECLGRMVACDEDDKSEEVVLECQYPIADGLVEYADMDSE